MTRAVVNVATTPYYQRGQARLFDELTRFTNPHGRKIAYVELPSSWPTHSVKPYAFKAYALRQAQTEGTDLLLWCDSSILPIRSFEPLWARIERDGYWFSKAGWNNYEWTADSAYPDLFPTSELCFLPGEEHWFDIEEARAINRKIPHVAATAFGLNMRHPLGCAFLDEYYRLASETRAFCGPWKNVAHVDYKCPVIEECAACGSPDVRGHRHDQTAASVIAWRLDFELTDPPDIFAYGRADEPHDERTILLADGSYA